MKKIAIICSIITVTAVAATCWQMHVYNQDVRRTLENEDYYTRQAYAQTEALMSRHNQTIAALENRLKELTNRPAGGSKAGST